MQKYKRGSVWGQQQCKIIVVYRQTLSCPAEAQLASPLCKKPKSVSIHFNIPDLKIGLFFGFSVEPARTSAQLPPLINVLNKIFNTYSHLSVRGMIFHFFFLLKLFLTDFK